MQGTYQRVSFITKVRAWFSMKLRNQRGGVTLSGRANRTAIIGNVIHHEQVCFARIYARCWKLRKASEICEHRSFLGEAWPRRRIGRAQLDDDPASVAKSCHDSLQAEANCKRLARHNACAENLV